MAVSLNAEVIDSTPSDATSFTQAITLGAGTNRKCIVFAGLEHGTADFTGVTFDGNAMTAPGGNGSPARVNSLVLGRLWYYDIPDGMSTGSKDVVISVDTSFGAVSWAVWIINGCATGALTDIQNDTDATTSVTLTATLTNASTAYVGAGVINGAAGTTAVWTNGDTTGWGDDTGNSQRVFASDATGTANATAEWTGSNTSNNKALIAWAVAEAAGGASAGQVVTTYYNHIQ